MLTIYCMKLIYHKHELLAKYTIKNKIGQLLTKYKHGNNIHDYRKL